MKKTTLLFLVAGAAALLVLTLSGPKPEGPSPAAGARRLPADDEATGDWHDRLEAQQARRAGDDGLAGRRRGDTSPFSRN